MKDLFGYKIKDRRKETEIQREVLNYLHLLNIFVWRNNNHGIPGRRFTGLKGVADILGIWHGKPLAVEIKSYAGRLSTDQKLFKERFEKEGGIYILARSINDLKNVFTNYSK